MKCCRIGTALAVAAGLGVGTLWLTGVGGALYHRAKDKIERQVPPDVQIEQLKIDISKLSKDVDKNWTAIAKYEHEVKELRKELERKQAKLTVMEKELAAAAEEVEAKVKFVNYEGKQYDRSQALRLLDREASYFAALKREVASKEKLLTAREQKLAAALATQKEMKSQQQELLTQVALLEADLETLKLMRTESKLPTGEGSRLDKIKQRLVKLQTDVEIQKRAQELSESSHGGMVGSADQGDVADHDAVLKRVRAALQGNASKADH
jgi:chromosome segregation ATPase